MTMRDEAATVVWAVHQVRSRVWTELWEGRNVVEGAELVQPTWLHASTPAGILELARGLFPELVHELLVTHDVDRHQCPVRDRPLVRLYHHHRESS